MLRNMTDEKRTFYRMVFVLLLPIIGQNLIDALVTSADVIILGQGASQAALSAVSIASHVQFILSMIMFGLATGTAMLSAQYWGKGDVRTIEKVLGIALRFSIPVGLAFTLAAFLIPAQIIGIFTPDPETIQEGVIYLRFVAMTYLFSGFTLMYLSIMRSMEQVMLSMVIYLVSFGLNVVLNIYFLFGLNMGTKGIALATLIARGLELTICIVHAARNKSFRVRIGDVFAKNKVLLSDFIRFAMPSIGNDIAFGVGYTLYSAILGHIAIDMPAALSIVNVVAKLGAVLCFGVSSGTAIILGKTLGADRIDDANLYAKRLVRLTILSAIVGGLLILSLTPFAALLGPNLSETALGYVRWMLLINAYYVMGKAINTVMICGIFRAGGDSKFGFICDGITYWVVMLPLGCLCAFVLKLPPLWVYFILCLDEFLKMPFIVRHYRKRGWLKNITREFST